MSNSSSHEEHLGISYQHLRGVHLISSYNTNINPNGTRPDPTRGNIKPYSSVFDSYYDGLEVSYQQRPVSWGSARISYTWSHAIDDVSEFFFSSPINNFDFGVDRSRSDDDQRNRVVFDCQADVIDQTDQQLCRTPNTRLAAGRHSAVLLPAAFQHHDWRQHLQQTSQRPCAPGYSLTANGGINPCTEALPGAVIGRNAGMGFDFFSLNARLSRTFALTERSSSKASRKRSTASTIAMT